MNQPGTERNTVICSGARRLAVVAGFFTAAAGFRLGGGYLAFVASFLILGVVVQPYSPRPGRWLIWTGACYLTLAVLGESVILFPGAVDQVRRYREPVILGMLAVWSLAVLLVFWCDSALVMEAWGLRRGCPVRVRRSPDTGGWLTWAAALCLNLMLVPCCVLSVIQYRTVTGFHDFSFPLVSFSLVIGCDAAMVIDAWKLRDRRTVAGPRSPAVGEWLVWLAALGLSLTWVPVSVLGVFAYRRHGGLGNLLFSLASGLVVDVLDVALVVNAVKIWRDRRATGYGGRSGWR